MISHVSFTSLPATDLDCAKAFGRDVMGLTVTVDSDMMPGLRWIMLRMDDARTEIHLDKVDAMPVQDRPALPLIAPGVPGAIETLRAKGVEILIEPKPAEWNPATTYAIVRDSEGNAILLASG